MIGWGSVYTWNQETFGPDGTLGRLDPRKILLTCNFRAAIIRLNPELPEKAVADANEKLTRQDLSRSTLKHNQAFYGDIHCATRWEAVKWMVVCIDKVTCARVHQRVLPRRQK